MGYIPLEVHRSHWKHRDWQTGWVPSTLPPGEPAPADGALPDQAVAELGTKPFGIYVHVPFCARRCGYCDFNTYTASELRGQSGASRDAYTTAVRAELDLAARVLGDAAPPVSTVFFGGGTPTLLSAADLLALLAHIRDRFGLAEEAEVTTEANPDSVDAAYLAQLRAGGFNRLSLGMQSAVPHVLTTLDRSHDPDRLPVVMAWARDAGFEQVSVDLIYGTPGESVGDWETSLKAAIALRPDHVSAYSLIVEPGTALARRVARGEVPPPDDDDAADKYVVADEMLQAAGLAWYEISNWARDEASESAHNRLYWTGGHWWGAGPGAHSHVGGVRWWNVKHPAAYSARLGADRSPAQAREVLAAETRRVERVLLELRVREGVPVEVLDPAGATALSRLERQGLAIADHGRVVLTRRGRLLADAVTQALLP
jgi:oxygen-independent coproporphyrinogen-3 oxidase